MDKNPHTRTWKKVKQAQNDIKNDFKRQLKEKD